MQLAHSSTTFGNSSPAVTITDDYRSLQTELHRDAQYGLASQYFGGFVAHEFRKFGVKTVLDYGAGKGRLQQAMALKNYFPEYIPFDPAIPTWSASPAPAEGVACIDVLEHVEPECIVAVLDDLERVTERFAVFTVHTGPAQKVLSDGRNAHLIQRPASWWLPLIMQRFELQTFQTHDHGFVVVVSAK